MLLTCKISDLRDVPKDEIHGINISDLSLALLEYSMKLREQRILDNLWNVLESIASRNSRLKFSRCREEESAVIK